MKNATNFRLFCVGFCCPGIVLAAWILVAPIERLLAMRQQPLVYAVYVNDVPTVKRFLDEGIDANADFRDPDWEDVPRNTLMIACERGNAPIVRLLLDHGHIMQMSLMCDFTASGSE